MAEPMPLVAPLSATVWKTHDPLEDTDAASELPCGCLPGRPHGTMCEDKIVVLPTRKTAAEIAAELEAEAARYLEAARLLRTA
jgi:hypothetical protein